MLPHGSHDEGENGLSELKRPQYPPPLSPKDKGLTGFDSDQDKEHKTGPLPSNGQQPPQTKQNQPRGWTWDTNKAQ